MSNYSLFYIIIVLIIAIVVTGCTSSPAFVTPIPALTTAPTVSPSPAQLTTLSLTWLGQSTFILTTSIGMTALLDPMGSSVGYSLSPVNGVDLVTISHEHTDHNNNALATGNPLVLHGLMNDNWAKIDQIVKGVRVYTVPSYHDDSQGSQRGKNTIFVYNINRIKAVHLGDLGHKLNADQIKAIGSVDVLMIPVGGFFTIDGRGAAEVVGQLNPKIIIPMHYKTPALSASLAGQLATADNFISSLSSSTQVIQAGHTIILSPITWPSRQTLMIMSYQ